jgi:SAM-dependent methyltransferase
MQFGSRALFNYFQCQECGCLQIEEYPADIESHYGGNYYSLKTKNGLVNRLKKWLYFRRDLYAAGGKNTVGWLLYQFLPSQDLKSTFDAIAPELKKVTGGKILDIGCGTGYFLEILDGLGLSNLFGIDPFVERDFSINNKISIFKKEMKDLNDKFDLIFMNHSLEHMPSQQIVATKIYNLLTNDGIAIIRIPLSSSYAWEHYGVNWYQLDAPRHFYLHSLKSIEKTLNQARLSIYKIAYDSTESQILGSEFYKRDIPYINWHVANKGHKIFSFQEMTKFREAASSLNCAKKGDQAIFFIKKNQN